MHHKLAIVTIAVLAAASGTVPAAAQIGNPAGTEPASAEKAPGKPAPTEANSQDRLFVQLIGAGGLAEIDAGKLADGKAGSAAAKSFGALMAQDHSRSNDRLASIAKKSDIPMPAEPAPEHKMMRAVLDTLKGRDFDLAYLRGQLVEHQKAAQILTWEISNGQAAELKRFAADTLPIILQHLELVQQHLSSLTGTTPQGLAAAAPTAPGAPRAPAAGGNQKQVR